MDRRVIRKILNSGNVKIMTDEKRMEIAARVAEKAEALSNKEARELLVFIEETAELCKEIYIANDSIGVEEEIADFKVSAMIVSKTLGYDFKTLDSVSGTVESKLEDLFDLQQSLSKVIRYGAGEGEVNNKKLLSQLTKAMSYVNHLIEGGAINSITISNDIIDMIINLKLDKYEQMLNEDATIM